MASNNSTVISLKTNFLRTQTRILSQPLQPAEGGRGRAEELPESVVKDVVREVNRQLRRHNKSVYPTVAIHHVAEQIDALYWNAGAPELYLEHSDGADDGVVKTEDDLSSDETIAKLPESWHDEDDDTAADQASIDRYATNLQHLQSLSTRRAALAQKLARYRTLQRLLGPLRAPAESVQPNLVTRDAALGAELGKARTLGVRVAARVGEWGAVEGAEAGEEREGEAWRGLGKEKERKRVEGEKVRGVMEWG